METTIDTSEIKQWKRYEEMRNLPLDWELSIPDHWQTHRLKEVADARPSNVDKKSKEGERSVLLCNYVDVYKNELISSNLEFMESTASDSQIEQFLIQADDVIITKDSEAWDDIGVPAYVPEAIDNLVCGYHLTLIRPNAKHLIGSYLTRCLEANGLRDQFCIAANGVTRFGLGTQDIRCFVLPIPPLSEQHAIAAFLDRETARIDALIERKERLITLLEEKRQAVISHAVTQGLDPNVEMKGFGQYGVQEIPLEWTVTRLKYVTPEVTVGVVVTPSKYYVPNGVIALRGTNIREGRVREEDLVYFSDEGHKLNSKSKLQKGDLVAVRSGQPGTTAVIPDHLDGTNCIDLILIRKSNKVDSFFLCYLANSRFAKLQYGAGTDGAIQQHFNVETAENMVIILPSLDEQRQIVLELDRVTEQIANLSLKISKGIERLLEYRTALISAAVTGQIDVREEVQIDG